MLDDLFYFFREGLTEWKDERVPHRASLNFDADYCEQYTRASHLSDFRVLLAVVLERALAGVPLHGQALDLACGPGVLLGELAGQRPGMAFVGIDLSRAMLAEAERHIQHEHIANVRLMQGDMAHLPEIFGEQRFDLITWTFGLHYCPTAQQALATLNAAADLLRPGGTFFLVDLVRFKREATRRWFAHKYDREHGDSFFAEIQESYLASFSPTELADLLSKSRLRGMTMEWSRLFPVILFAHNRGVHEISPVHLDLPWRQRLKRAALRAVFDRSVGQAIVRR
ncbi:putative O-methyltransferase [Candidatus Accumulibacter aalborgensis]|uniref:Putative O-methyltransferase n=2 Tax=Candidatus Accumulibacter aalborgensis TaxID=1860102 RepID=A0A1A8XE50_9PROT|nr:putative O-methyltransferase [Candidatus Accumulibacter aalborgensis]